MIIKKSTVFQGVIVIMMLLVIIALSSCSQSYNRVPLATPTLIPTGLFVSPFPSGQDPMQVIADLGTQTSVSETQSAGGGPTETAFVATWEATVGAPFPTQTLSPTPMPSQLQTYIDHNPSFLIGFLLILLIPVIILVIKILSDFRRIS
jgi:hypothetical protein